MTSIISPARTSAISTVGERLRKARRERGLTQDKLSEPRFTKGYVSAVERGTVHPSLKALEFFAQRLELPISHFLVSTRNVDVEPEMEALEEDLNYQFNYARMLIRDGQTGDAFQIISKAEKNAEPYRRKIAARIMYRAPYLRGLAYMQTLDAELAKPEFENALAILRQNKDVAGVGDAEVMVNNMLGIAFYQTEQPHMALEHHLACRRAVDRGAIKDLSLRLSIYRNLAGDYLALNDVPEAIATYRKALTFIDELSSLEKQAGLFWGLATSYNASGNWAEAKLYATQALHIAEASDDRVTAANMGINLAEIFIAEKRYIDAEKLLNRAEGFLASTEDQALLSNLYQNYADLARRQGQLEKATEYIGRSLTLIEEAEQQGDNKKGHAHQRKSRAKAEGQDRQDGTNAPEKGAEKPPLNIVRTHVQALHTAALVEEARGNSQASDEFFKQALELAEGKVFAETIYKVHYSYAEVLAERGAYEGAAVHYRIAAQVRPYGTQSTS
jgi:tetratricopeptide (TPR) repeat protein